MSNTAAPAPHLVFKRSSLPYNLYHLFVVEYSRGKHATFLPVVLWPGNPLHFKTKFREEIEYLRAETVDNITSTVNHGRPPALLSYALTAPYIFKFVVTGALPAHDLLFYT